MAHPNVQSSLRLHFRPSSYSPKIMVKTMKKDADAKFPFADTLMKLCNEAVGEKVSCWLQ